MLTTESVIVDKPKKKKKKAGHAGHAHGGDDEDWG